MILCLRQLLPLITLVMTISADNNSSGILSTSIIIIIIISIGSISCSISASDRCLRWSLRRSTFHGT